MWSKAIERDVKAQFFWCSQGFNRVERDTDLNSPLRLD